MRYLLLLLVFISVCACKPNPGRKTYAYKGIVLGKDTGGCSCCGGYMIKVEEDTIAYRFRHFPADAPMDTTKFPVRVLLNYTEMDSCGGVRFIAIQDMQQNYRNSFYSTAE